MIATIKEENKADLNKDTGSDYPLSRRDGKHDFEKGVYNLADVSIGYRDVIEDSGIIV